MECDICASVRESQKTQPQNVVPVTPAPNEAKFAVKENDLVLYYCNECMLDYFGMHITVLLVGDTYIVEGTE